MTLRTGTWPGFVSRVETKTTPAILADELVEAWAVLEGGEIPAGVLLCGLAQILVETATRQDPNRDGVTTADEQADGLHSGNVGNLRGSFLLDGVACWTSYFADEILDGKRVVFEPGPENRFRSYLSPAERKRLGELAHDDPEAVTLRRLAVRRGVRDYLSLLLRKYRKAINAAARGDFHGFVRELRAGGYFTAELARYDRAETKLRASVDDEVPQVAAFLRGVVAGPEPERLEP